MSNEIKRPVRKATFLVEKVKGKRVFTVVNKRAIKLAKTMGKRRKLTVTELKAALEKRPSMRAYAYDNGALEAVKF